jgi:peptide/nickel transport system substrate-binding protein
MRMRVWSTVVVSVLALALVAPGGNADGPQVQAVYDTLAYIDPKTQVVVPRLATSITPTNNGIIWTVKLRKGVKFSDGTTFDANAVKASWDRFNDPAKGAAIRSTLSSLA